jgi:hypothetical protein
VTAFEAWATPGAMVVRDARLGQVHVLMPGASEPVTLDLDALPPLPPGTPVLGDLAAEAAARTGGRAVAAPPLAPAIGRVALGRLHGANPRPAPLYLRAPDAAPARPAPPVLP